MEQRLIPANPALVRQEMARAFLAVPAITAEQGEIRLAPHQVEAASRLLSLLVEHGGAVLADATGLGKTFVAIALARLLQPALVVAPAALRAMWRESLDRTGVTARVESYESLSRRGAETGERPAFLVLDEAHHARNPLTQRYARVADLAWGAKVLLLTATPIHNRRRDLRALIALFLGSRANAMTDEQLSAFIVRRHASDTAVGAEARLPVIDAPRWLNIASDRDTLRAIMELPPAVPAADGGTAHALLVLGLIRAWSSSEAALKEVLRRRLRRAAVLAVALESGRLPDRRELDAWPVVDGAIQLGFPGLLEGRDAMSNDGQLVSALERHTEGVRAIVRALDNAGAPDRARAALLDSIRQRHAPVPVVAFTQFADTAAAAFRACVGRGGVALVTGRGARIASGHIAVDEVVRGFDIPGRSPEVSQAMPLLLLIATDVLSEGLSLRRAGVIVHLDLPWTTARLEQRVGRLRRFGSAYERLSVYAIGPPVGSRELVAVVRALQRKARLTTVVTGAEELATSLPLLGQRLARATASLARRGEAANAEELRKALTKWSERSPPVRPTTCRPEHTAAALVLLREGTRTRLVAVTAGTASENPADVLRAVEALSPGCEEDAVCNGTPTVSIESIARSVDRWLSEQRGVEMARPALDSPSPAHLAVLRALHQALTRASRSERASLAARIDRCRWLVTAARGIGAEFAMQRLLTEGSGADLDALEQLLEPRVSHASARHGTAHPVALLCTGPEGSKVIGYLVAADGITDGSPHPGPPRSSTLRAAHVAARG